MFYSKSSVTVLFLITICTVRLQRGQAVENTLVLRSNSSQPAIKEFLIINEIPFNDGSLVYARCNRESLTSIKCNVVQENYPNRTNTRQCLVTLEDDNGSSNLSTYIRLNAIGKDMAMFSWGSSSTGLLSLNTCLFSRQYFNKKFAKYYSGYRIVPYDDDSFDVFFNDPEHCGDKLCKMQINADGTAKGEPVASYVTRGQVHYISTIAPRSSSKGYVVLKDIGNDSLLSLVKPDGMEKQLEKYDNTTCPTVLASNSVVSVCIKINADSDVTCSQYDEDGKVKFTTTIGDQNKNINAKALYNLPDASVLVMLAGSKKSDQPSSFNSDIKYRLVKIAADGKVVGTTPIQEINDIISRFKKTHIYKYGDAGYCVVIIGLSSTENEQKPYDYVILANCFAESDFSTTR